MVQPSDSRPPSADIMNDPAYAIQRSTTDAANEPDHCRICRSEGTKEEPLFYPCKCSGSIKFVHQDCLMEWLQHSQKKYCDLCKTPFQFTKLYHPEMPKHLPPRIFLSRASKHLANTILLWLRFLLVCFVWLGVLPWVVRWMWRFWFWLGDGGWAWWRRKPYFVNASFTENNTVTDNATGIVLNNETVMPTEGLQAEWSNGGIFTNITRSATLNKIFLDTVEGQVLTALIVVTFVMIFLIREWVVQQQPDLAIAADVGGLENMADMEQAPEPAGDIVAEEDQDQDHDHDGEYNAVSADVLDKAYGKLYEDDMETAEKEKEESMLQPATNVKPRVYAPLPKRRTFTPVEENGESSHGVGTSSAFNGPGIMLGSSNVFPRSPSYTLDSNYHRRPQASREVMGQSVELRRQMEEEQYSSSVTIPRMRPPNGKSEPVDDDSDWEDEDDDGVDNLLGSGKSGESNARSASSFTLPTPPGAPPVVTEKSTFDFEVKGLTNPPLWPNATEERQPTVRFGQGQGSNLFGNWESTRKATFEFNIKDDHKLSWQQKTDSELETGKDTMAESSSDKGKGKAKDPQPGNAPFHRQNPHPGFKDMLDEQAVSKFSILSNEPEQARLADSIREPLLDEEKKENWAWNINASAATFNFENSGNSITREERDVPLEDFFLQESPVRPPTPAPNTPMFQAAAPDNHAAAPGEAPARGMGGPQARNAWFDWIIGDIPQPDRPGGPDVNQPAPEGARRADGIDTDDEDNDEWDEGQNGGQQIRVGAAEDVQDEADDFDGIMELIGMRGPLYGLVQNAAISIVLISAAVMLGVAVPYIWGRILLMVLAHPILFTIVIPWSIAVFCANLIIDSGIYAACNVMFAADFTRRLVLRVLSSLWPPFSDIANDKTFSNLMLIYANAGWKRVSSKLTTLALVLASDRTSMEGVSFITAHPETSHAWLASRQPWARATLAMSWFSEKVSASVNLTSSAAAQHNKSASEVIYTTLGKLVEVWKEPSTKQRNVTYVIPVASEAEEALVEFSNSSSWTAADRVVAVIAGYVLFTMVGAWYLSKHKSQPGSYRRNLEKTSIELLQQAGGVMKVILIIGIEMFVFPLYCGLLLDVALLPLFENATVISRIQFTIDHVFTSTFVHWFVGTCYMFHFALFVSMCRKIMRPGVLYFIRDPDDPTLHPVKDVLERPVMLQLRKIAFSAFIYGFLVLVCLGGVVWFLYSQFEGVLPIHWSSNEPVLEFPVDLLFYNFFMPVAVQFFKPSEVLQKMYAWWFQQCARFLRLTSFMFGDRRADEEGRTIRKTWIATLFLKGSDPSSPVTDLAEKATAEASDNETYFLRDGRFVRAPASDSVRRPKGQPVFIPVTENNTRLDGQSDPEDGETGPHSPNFRMVYIPPNFKTRIFLVVLSIWLFAAVTGVGVTIGPLLLGRALLETLVPKDLRMNDVYAFSIGIYIIGAVVYVITKYQAVVEWFNSIRTSWRNPGKAQRAIRKHLIRAIKVSYVLVAFALVLPTLLALMIEFYIIIPMHTYFSQGEVHVIHFIQDWTLGVLYVKMMGSMLMLDPESPWARALRGVVARGYLDPDVRLATRCFILPATMIMTSALLVPLGLAYAATKTILQDASPSTISQTYRYSYPAVFIFMVLLGIGYLVKVMVDKWKQSVRDEVYLIGEKLHNHGERKPPSAASTQKISTGVQTEADPLAPRATLLETNGT